MPLNPIDVHGFARLAAGGLLNSLVAGIGLAALAWLVARVAGRNSSSVRFVVWFVALMGIGMLPWAGSVVHSSGSTGLAPTTGAVTLPESLAYYLLVAWLFGVALGLTHVALGLFRLNRLRASCTPIDREKLDPALRATLDEIQPQRRVLLCTSETVRVPAAVGYFRPRVVFPAWTLAEIPTPELNAILLHELAHLRRYDDWTNLVQKLVKAFLFFHPAVWFIESRLTLEREIACDDAVLAANFTPRAYAESLVSLAEKSFLRRGLQLAQAAVSHVQQLKLRLAEILRKDRAGKHGVGLKKPGLALLSGAFMVAACGVVHAPRLIAFSDNPEQTVAVASPSAAPRLSDVRLEPVNLRYSGPVAPERVVSKPLAKVPHHSVSKPRAAVVRQADADRDVPLDAFSRAKLVAVAQREPTAVPVLIVFESDQFGANGAFVWQVTMYRLTQTQQRIITGRIPKQT
jgi:bla regulator protein blaR1